MKKKITVFLVVFILLFTNYVFAYTRVTDSTAKKLNRDARIITDKTLMSRNI